MTQVRKLNVVTVRVVVAYKVYQSVIKDSQLTTTFIYKWVGAKIRLRYD